VCARDSNRGLLRGPSTSPLSAMTSFPFFAAFMIVATFFTFVVFFWLQLSALRRHGHVSFLLLLIGTGCGLLSAGIGMLGHWLEAPAAFPTLFYYVPGILLLGQMILGIWGTVLLFRSYGALSDAGRVSRGNADHGA
jgi:hypothetical protein